uniref:Uncharacterized protein n=1 Tax=Ditylenchus dipsaci TaxID=166011 RepID=A0A915E8X2_9BILA
MEWARHALKGVQKKYFDRQREAMKNGWKELDEAIEEFHRNKSEENSKIAEIRAGLAEEKRKYSARNEEKQIKELEEEIKKLKSTDIQKTRLVSELRAKINGLEGTNKANEEAAAKNIQQLKDMSSRLTKSEMENSNLRVKMAMIKERTLTEVSGAGVSKSSATPKNTSGPQKRISLLGTPRFNRSTSATQFSNVPSADDSSRPRSAELSNKTVRWSSPVASSRPFSNFNPAFAVPTSSSRMSNSDMVNTKFEITSKGMLYKYNNLDFRWIGRTSNGRLQVYYSDAGKVYEVKTAEDSRILFFVNNQLEVHWKNGDKTEPEEINDNPSLMSRRSNGAYTYLVDGNSTEVKAPDFALRRVNDGFVKIVIQEVQLSFCVDNVFLAKHVVETKESDGRVKKQKPVCFSHGDCVHIKK